MAMRRRPQPRQSGASRGPSGFTVFLVFLLLAALTLGEIGRAHV